MGRPLLRIRRINGTSQKHLGGKLFVICCISGVAKHVHLHTMRHTIFSTVNLDLVVILSDATLNNSGSFGPIAFAELARTPKFN